MSSSSEGYRLMENNVYLSGQSILLGRGRHRRDAYATLDAGNDATKVTQERAPTVTLAAD